MCTKLATFLRKLARLQVVPEKELKMGDGQYILLGVCILSCLTSIHGYFVAIDAHAEECFHDKVTSGTKMALTFEVAEGGFLDIDVKVGNTIMTINKSRIFLFLRITVSSWLFYSGIQFMWICICIINNNRPYALTSSSRHL